MFMQVAVLHNDLATALEMAGEYVEAEKHVAESLEVAGSVSGGGNIAEHLAMFYYNLGTILSRQGTVTHSQFTVLSKYVCILSSSLAPRLCKCSLGMRLTQQLHPISLASFPGLQSPNAVEGLVKLICRMASGRRWRYTLGRRWVDVG